VLRLFEEARQSPGAAYEPERFMAYLTSPPASSGRRVADTFAGRRRLVRFMDSVQLEFGICFTNEEWERGLALAEFTTLVEAKRANPKQAERLAAKRLQEARTSRTDEPIKFAILAGVLLAVPAAFGGPIVRALLILLWVAIILTVVIVNVRQCQYARKLVERTAAAPSPLAGPP
jgi:hypothetical protein